MTVAVHPLPPSAHQWLREQIARLERFVEERT